MILLILLSQKQTSTRDSHVAVSKLFDVPDGAVLERRRELAVIRKPTRPTRVRTQTRTARHNSGRRPGAILTNKDLALRAPSGFAGAMRDYNGFPSAQRMRARSRHLSFFLRKRSPHGRLVGRSTGFFVELAIEPLPFGAHSMAHIDWSADALGLEGVTHSWTYANPSAIRYIQDWVKTALQCRQT
jgi:hypothetical protein